MPRSILTALILVMAAVSGAAALTYEVVWFRGLGLVFGVASHSVAAVVGVFLLGLGLGAWAAGRWLGSARPLLTYAIVEALIAVAALASPSLLGGLRALVERGDLPGASTLVALVGAFAVLLVPTLLMGATFPLLARALAVDDDPRRASPHVGWLYGVNTLGAGIGVLLAAFVLMPQLGMLGSTHVAASANGAVAVLAAVLAYTGRAREARVVAVSKAQSATAPEHASTSPTAAPALPLYAAVFAIGFAALVLQVIGNRLILSLLGGTVYVFASIVAVFLVGIAAGGAIGGHLARRAKRPHVLLAQLAWLFAAATAFGVALLVWRTGGEDLLAGPENMSVLPPGVWPDAITPGRYLRATFELALIALLPATLISGAFLPAAIAAARVRHGGLGAVIGRVYLVNTLGSIAGSLVASFLLLPNLGLRGGFVAAAVVAFVAGAVLLLAAVRHEEPLGRLTKACVALGLASAFVFVPHDPPGTSDGRVTIYHGESAASAAKVQEFSDVVEPLPLRNLRVNGKTVASTIFIDRRLQYLLGFVSTLVHPDPRTMLCIGLGTGMTPAAMATAGGELTVVEISPSVVEAARHFAAWNEALHERSDTTIVVDDGRAWLTRTEQRFDVISADPIDPCVSGSAYLYTREYYELGRSRLAPGGLMSQWIPLYDLSPTDIAGIVLTFHQVFPHATAWVTGYDMMLIGANEPLALEPSRVEQRFADPRVAELLADVGIDSAEELIGTCFAGPTALTSIAALADRPNTDNDPWIEFSAPRASFGTFPLPIFRALATSTDLPPLHEDVGGLSTRTIDFYRAELQSEMLAFVNDIESGQSYGNARTRYIEALRSDD